MQTNTFSKPITQNENTLSKLTLFRKINGVWEPMTSEKDIDSTFPYIEEKENNPPEVHKEIEDIVTNYDTLHFPELFEEKFK